MIPPPPEQSRWFAEEVHPHDGQLKAYLRGNFPSVRDVDDVVQESYLRVWKAKTAKPIASAKAYLFTVARHLALCGVMEDRPSVADVLTEQEKIELLTDALAALPARPRAILLLHKFEGL